MEPLWSPWRMAYLEDSVDLDQDACFLCAIGAGQAKVAGIRVPEEGREESGVVWRGERTFALLNAFPYANGHVMVAPVEHVGELARLDTPTANELIEALQLVLTALRSVYDPEGFNVGANLGSAAGAGLSEHLHFHAVPRWTGDTNFMTTLGGQRVIPEELHRTARRLRRALRELMGRETAFLPATQESANR